MANRYYRRSAVLEVGGFNEELHVMENLDIQWRLKKAGYKVILGEGVVFFHHRPADRFTLRFVLRNAFTYGYYWNKLRQIHPDNVGLSANPVKTAAFIVLVLLSYFYPPTLWVFLASLSFWFAFKFYRDKVRVKNCITHMRSKIEKMCAVMFSLLAHILYEIVEELGKLYGSLAFLF